MNTGKRNRRISLVTHGTMTDDGIGGFTEGAVATPKIVWCSARQLSMTEQLSYGLETTTAAYEFRFTFFDVDAITNLNYLIYNGKNFRIASVQNIDEEKKEIRIIANERVN